MQGTLDKKYHLKNSEFDRITKLILANNANNLANINDVDLQVGFACAYYVNLQGTIGLTIMVLEKLITSGQEFTDSEVENEVRDNLLRAASELDGETLCSLLPLFKSFDLNSDESYLIKTEQVRKAVEKVFLEILIIKKRTYNQTIVDYLSQHPLCAFYPIEPDGQNGVTIENFWSKKPEETSSSAASPVNIPWTFKRVLKYIGAFVCIGYMWRYMFTNVLNVSELDSILFVGPGAILLGLVLTGLIVVTFDNIFSTDQSEEEQETFMEKVKIRWPYFVVLLFATLLEFSR